ncbi:MAG TPA: transcription antitermination factor NusB [Chloroflexota bacterium]|nr:transcription antitermination factor NusB [Chloroflexota bacterium]
MSSSDGRSLRSIRRKGRVEAFQALFEADLVGHDPLEILERKLSDESQDPSVGIFARHLVEGVLAHREATDRMIAQAAPAWPLAQMPPVDKNLLRLAIFELMFDNQRVPVKAAINEAVDIAKTYGSENSGRFVNGVLGTIAEELGEAGRGDGSTSSEESAG